MNARHTHTAAQRENDSTYDASTDTCEGCREAAPKIDRRPSFNDQLSRYGR